MISLARETLAEFEEGIQREWVVANGLGGYASATAVGACTRRYHGLLLAAVGVPARRLLLVSQLEDELVINDRPYPLSTNQYPGVIHPEGFRHLESFRLDPFPVFRYRLPGAVLEKTVFMVSGENVTVVRYRLTEATGGVTLRVRPLVNCRDYHGQTYPGGEFFPQTATTREAWPQVAMALPGLDAPLTIAADAGSYTADGRWYRNMEYRREAERGLFHREDHQSPGCFESPLRAHETWSLVFSLGSPPARASETLYQEAVSRVEGVRAGPLSEQPRGRDLMVAADSFVVRRPESTPEAPASSVIAGYHWFGDWGRDAMIALPGLTLVTGRFEQARAILRFFGSQVHRGLVPNFVEGTGQAAYNSADASLWFINAVWQYVRYTGDWSLVDELAGGLREIAAAYRFGTDYGIVVDDDGLVRCGQGEDQVTWMDAKVDGRAMTPRHGKPVEISALWYNAMRCLDQFATHRRWPQPTYRAAADRCRESFRSAFWNAEEGCLFDVLGERPDASIRPNQLLAVSLPFPALEGEEARSVVGRVERDLLTPFGLRTLAPTDPRYRGVYAGDQYQRDAAYHQGTVWAWLIGPFVTAWVRVRGGTPAARREAAGFLGGFDEHLATAGLGSISEIFDGDSPHAPKGCISQAWSVGEVLRCYNEDVLGREPTGDRGDTA